MPRTSAKDKASIYQLKITLRGIRPPIWRRVLVPGRFTLFKLHRVILAAFGWSDYHLHQYHIDEAYYSVPSPEDFEPVIDERRFKLQNIASEVRRKFIYEYDFGDSWEHELLVEKILGPEPGLQYPVCVAGKRACPPEDVGGRWGYAAFLQAIADPEHPEHASQLEWAGEEFDPEACDLKQINQLLKKVK